MMPNSAATGDEVTRRALPSIEPSRPKVEVGVSQRVPAQTIQAATIPESNQTARENSSPNPTFGNWLANPDPCIHCHAPAARIAATGSHTAPLEGCFSRERRAPDHHAIGTNRRAALSAKKI